MKATPSPHSRQLFPIIAFLCVLANCSPLCAQKTRGRTRTLSGPQDSEFSYPAHEGMMGQKDSAALAEIKQFTEATALPEHSGLEVAGTVTSGSGNDAEKNEASFTVENGARFRFDVKKGDGNRTLRINGEHGQAKRGNDTAQELEDTEFVNPLAIPFLLLEIANQKDAAVVDDGTVTVNERSMHKVTITRFKGRFGNSASASFYFDTDTHLLRKGVFVEHSAGNRSLEYLLVMSYRDYRKEQSVVFPHECVETVYGQPSMKFVVASAAMTSAHEDSFFSF